MADFKTLVQFNPGASKIPTNPLSYTKTPSKHIGGIKSSKNNLLHITWHLEFLERSSHGNRAPLGEIVQVITHLPALLPAYQDAQFIAVQAAIRNGEGRVVPRDLQLGLLELDAPHALLECVLHGLRGLLVSELRAQSEDGTRWRDILFGDECVRREIGWIQMFVF